MEGCVMRKFLIVSVVCLSILAFSQITDVLELAKQNTPSYLNATLELEQAKSDYEKATIEAKNKLDQLEAELSWLQSKQSYNTAIKDFLSEFFDAYFGVFENQLALQVAQDNLRIAEIDFDQQQSLYKTGVATLQELQEASATKLEATAELEEAKLSLEQTKRDLQNMLGKEIEFKDLPDIVLNITLPSLDELMEKSLSIKIADLNVQIAQINYDGLVNPSQYTKSKYERTLKSSQNTLKDTQNDTKKSYETALQNIETIRKNILAQKERLEASRLEYESTKSNYNAGVSSEKDLLNAEISYFNAQKTFITYVKSLLENICSIFIDAELDYVQALSQILGG
ncbi:MAG TPA: hypothetical protein DDY74_07785 [Pseudothermotoga sp.]|nr:hypothetical protein [Pseudothermotoga sp.]